MLRKRTSIVNTAITFALTAGLVFVAALIVNGKYGVSGAEPLLYYLIGGIVFGLLNAFAHEFGHILACKKNGFLVLSTTVWFFKWTRVNKRMRFNFTLIGDEAGYTESIPTHTDNMEIRYKRTALGGIYASLIALVVGVGLTFTVYAVSYRVFCVLSMALPVSAYYFFGNALPAINYGEKNDGAVVYGIKKKDISTAVAVSLLKIQAELMSGKTPSEIDEKLYFDLPQLPEDDLNFIRLLSARYGYYLDKEDYENAKKISDRLYGLVDQIPKIYEQAVKMDALYGYCTYDFNEDMADEIMYELEKPLNAVNDATNIRLKLAYLLYVKKEYENVKDMFFYGLKRAEKSIVKGLGLYEKKLLLKMKEDVEKAKPEKSDGVND